LLAELVVANKRIGELDLQMNQVTDSGIRRLAQAVPQSGLSQVHVANNSVTEVGARALLEASRLLHKLTGRTLSISGISDAFMTAARRSQGGGGSTPQPPTCSSGGDGGRHASEAEGRAVQDAPSNEAGAADQATRMEVEGLGAEGGGQQASESSGPNQECTTSAEARAAPDKLQGVQAQ